jgi:hypothetical protein
MRNTSFQLLASWLLDFARFTTLGSQPQLRVNRDGFNDLVDIFSPGVLYLLHHLCFMDEVLLIGKGAYGRVYKGHQRPSGRLVAIKVLDIDSLETTTESESRWLQ